MWIDLLISGLVAGCLYGLVAVSFNILYRPTKVFNFAQGDLVMLGAMGAALLITAKWPWWMALLVAGAGLAVLAVIEERVAVSPILRRGGHGHGWVITTLAMSMMLTNAAGKLLPADPMVIPAPWPFSTATLAVEGVSVSSWQLALIAITLLLVWGIDRAYRSQWGKAALAVAEDRDAAVLRGIDPVGISRWSWAIGGAFCALTGYLASPVLNASTGMGGALLLKGFAAAAIGGLGSNRGALIAGVLIGLIETAVAQWLSNGYQNASLLILVLAILLVRPGGIFSSLEARTV
jgi:branched-chain amino acid transport system permease protein